MEKKKEKPERKEPSANQQKEPKPFNPQRFPSYFRLFHKKDDKTIIPIPVGGEKTLKFETDVEDHYFDRTDDVPWIFINWMKKYYYIQEENNGYSYGYCKGNSDAGGLASMQAYVEGVIAKHNLQKPEII